MSPALLNAAQYGDFSRLITERLGIRMPESKRVMLQSRLQRRLREVGVPDLAAYHQRFFADAVFQEEEMTALLDLATTNRTEFWREPEHFRFLAETLVPQWQARGRRVRVWCCGCSTGEEAYTLAMVLEAVGDYEVVASDVSTEVLRRAVRGVYPVSALAALPPQWRTEYFETVTGEDPSLRRVRASLRRRIRFGHLNLLAPRYQLAPAFDALFFRNVMIYFDRSTQREVVAKLLPFLEADGHLFTAHAETLQGLGLPVRQVRAAVYQKHGYVGGGVAC